MINSLNSRNLTLASFVPLQDEQVAETIFEIIKKLRISTSRPGLKRKKTRKMTNSSSLKLLHSLSSNNTLQLSPVEASRRVSLKTTPKCYSSPYSIDQTLTLNNVFQLLGEFYRHTSWVKACPSLEIHSVILKQFLLDCFLSDQKLFHCILEPVKNKLWITCEDFLKCVEELHIGYRWKFFASSRIKKHENRNIQKQKLVSFEKGQLLDRENIKKAISFAERQNNFKLEHLTEFFMQKATQDRNLSFYADIKDLLKIAVNL